MSESTVKVHLHSICRQFANNGGPTSGPVSGMIGDRPESAVHQGPTLKVKPEITLLSAD